MLKLRLNGRDAQKISVYLLVHCGPNVIKLLALLASRFGYLFQTHTFGGTGSSTKREIESKFAHHTLHSPVLSCTKQEREREHEEDPKLGAPNGACI